MKPWEETWHASMSGHSVRREDGSIVVEARGAFREGRINDLDLCAAAPDLVRELLRVEWLMLEEERTGQMLCSCPACRGLRFHGHHSTCALDAALTKAGLDTPLARDEAREALAEAS